MHKSTNDQLVTGSGDPGCLTPGGQGLPDFYSEEPGPRTENGGTSQIRFTITAQDVGQSINCARKMYVLVLCLGKLTVPKLRAIKPPTMLMNNQFSKVTIQIST